MLPWGLHLATAYSELLRCLLRQDTIVDDRRHVELTANRVSFDQFLSWKSSGLFLIIDIFPAGFNRHGNSRISLYGNRPRQEPFPRERCSHHRDSRGCLCRNRPSRERFPPQPATVGTSHRGNSRGGSTGFFPRTRLRRNYAGRERAIFLSLQPLKINQYVCMDDT